jgi:hypothetical protein
MESKFSLFSLLAYRFCLADFYAKKDRLVAPEVEKHRKKKAPTPRAIHKL